MHVRKFDIDRNNRFPKTTGVMATKLEAKLGIDYEVFKALNMLGKRNTFKHLD